MENVIFEKIYNRRANARKRRPYNELMSSPLAMALYSHTGMQIRETGPRRPLSLFGYTPITLVPKDDTESQDDDEDSDSSDACMPKKCHQCDPPSRCPCPKVCPTRRCQADLRVPSPMGRWSSERTGDNQTRRGRNVEVRGYINYGPGRRGYRATPTNVQVRRSMGNGRMSFRGGSAYAAPRAERGTPQREPPSSSDESSEADMDMSDEDPCPSRIDVERCPPRCCGPRYSPASTGISFKQFYDSFRRSSPELNAHCSIAKARMLYKKFNIKNNQKMFDMITGLESDMKVPLLRFFEQRDEAEDDNHDDNDDAEGNQSDDE